MSTRQQQVLDTASELFASRGFHGVSMHDIGAACGISGPALYKHFTGKDDILTQCLIRISERLLDEGTRRAGAAADADAALDALLGWHVEFALDHPSLIVVQEREWTNLDDDARGVVRRLQLAYIDLWVGTLRALRPEVEAPEARAVVQATFGLLNSTPHSARLSAPTMRALLVRSARAALLPRD